MSNAELIFKHITAPDEWWTIAELAERVGCGRPYISAVKMTAAKTMGYTFENEGTRYRCTNPEHQPDLTIREAYAQRAKATKARRATRERAFAVRQEKRRSDATRMAEAGHTIEALKKPSTLLGLAALDGALPLAVPPALGEGVQVFAMILSDDGTLRMGLQNGERRWVVDVVGEMLR